MQTVMGVDLSTQSIAFSIFTGDGLKHYGKIYLQGETIYDRCGFISSQVRHLVEIYSPELIVIEAAVFVNNRQVVKKLSALVGAVAGVGVRSLDVPPVTWQTHIGNPLLTNTEKAKIKKKAKSKTASATKKAFRQFRKSRTISIVNKLYDIDVDDDDVADAIGVGHWARDQYIRTN